MELQRKAEEVKEQQSNYQTGISQMNIRSLGDTNKASMASQTIINKTDRQRFKFKIKYLVILTFISIFFSNSNSKWYMPLSLFFLILVIVLFLKIFKKIKNNIFLKILSIISFVLFLCLVFNLLIMFYDGRLDKYTKELKLIIDNPRPSKSLFSYNKISIYCKTLHQSPDITATYYEGRALNIREIFENCEPSMICKDTAPTIITGFDDMYSGKYCVPKTDRPKQ